MDEIWKPVPSKPGLMASNLGRVCLPEVEVPMPLGGVRPTKPKPKIGYVCCSKKGAKHQYRSFSNRHYGRIKIHIAVCEAFHGPKPFPRAVVLHEDEDGLNNHESNLRWGTQKENMNMPKLKEYHRSRTGDKSPRIIGRARGSGY